MTKAKQYRGKYPRRIRTVWGSTGAKGMMVRLNDGWSFLITPMSPIGRNYVPRPGDDLEAFRKSPHYRVV